MTVTHTALCTVKGCPAPKDPDWHKPWCGHGVAGEHQHWPKRSQGGKRIVAFLCHDCHDHIDNGDWGNAVLTTIEDGKRVEVYRAWDLHNKTIIEQIIGINDALSDGAEETTALAAESNAGGAMSPTASASSLKEESDGQLDSLHGGRIGGRDLDVGGRTIPLLTHDQRVAITAGIKDAQLRRQFLAGDTANEWDEELGEDFWNLYANEFGYTYPSLRNVMRVCKNIPPNKRNPEASFALHDVVDGFDFETQEAWLERAVTEEWTVKRLREELVAEGLLGAKPRLTRYTWEDIHDLADEYTLEAARDVIKDFADWLHMRDDE